MTEQRQRIFVAALLLLFGITLFFFIIPSETKNAQNELIDPSFLPYVVSILIIIISFYIIISEIKIEKQMKKKYQSNKGNDLQKFSYLRLFIAFITLIFWGITIPYLGFIITSFITTCLLMFTMGNRSWISITSVSLIFTTFAYIIFVIGLRVRLPSGIFL